MFTLKHVTLEGNEELHYGDSPMYVSANSLEGRDRGNAIVHYTDAKGQVCDIRYGKVYVMNEHGRTVATYDMGSPSILGNFQASAMNAAFNVA